MTRVTKTLCGVDFELNEAGAPPVFIFGIRKSGSSIMNSMINAVAKFNGTELIDIAGKLFQHGVPVEKWRDDPALADFFLPGNVYGGFRTAPYPIFDQPAFAQARGVLLVRDPRDALCSEYFSNAYSHSLPAEGPAREQMLKERQATLAASIEEFARTKAQRFRSTMREYLPILDHPGFRLYHYEKAIMDKGWFLRDVAQHLGWTLTDHQLEMILGWADVKPVSERPDQFVRRVTPGDHKDKFNADLIAHLNAIFAEELARFGYPA